MPRTLAIFCSRQEYNALYLKSNNNYYQVKMKKHTQLHTGTPLPLGATITTEGVNFALFSRHAHTVTLVLDLPEDGTTKQWRAIHLDPKTNKTGDIWHVRITELAFPLYYGYILDGPDDPWGSGHVYNNKRILLDPYAKELRPAKWGAPRDDLGVQPCCRPGSVPAPRAWRGPASAGRPVLHHRASLEGQLLSEACATVISVPIPPFPPVVDRRTAPRAALVPDPRNL